MTQTWMIPALTVAVSLLLFYWWKRQDSDPDRYRRKAIETYHAEPLPANAGEEMKIVHFIKAQAAALYRDEALQNEAIDLWKISEEGDRPLLVLVMGEFNTGKSTFINAILQENVLVTDGLPATAVVSLLRYGEKRKAVLHYADGRQKGYDFEKLADITAEGNDTKQGLRDKLEYVELFLPNELLKEIQIIDTPGLNVNKDSHIRRTTHFQDKADIVLWLFNASRSPTRTELDVIRTLGDRLKPYAVVNRIDNIDEEEESVEEVLERIEKRMGKSIQAIVGVSSLLAEKAIDKAGGSPDRNLLQKAGWTHFQDFLQSRIMKKKSALKRQSLLDKLTEFHQTFQMNVTQKQEACRQQAGWFSNAEEERKKIEAEIASLQDQYTRVMSYSNQVEGLIEAQRSFCSGEDIDPIANRKVMKDNMAILLQFAQDQITAADGLCRLVKKLSYLQQIQIAGTESLDTFRRKWQHYSGEGGELDGLESELEALAAEKEEIGRLQVEYDHSGIFGNEPIFDFSGRRERLNNKKEEFNRHIDRIKALAANLWQKCGSLSEEILGILTEMKRLSDEIGQSAEALHREKQRSIQEFATNFQQKKADYDKACASVDFGKKVAQAMGDFLERYKREESEECV